MTDQRLTIQVLPALSILLSLGMLVSSAQAEPYIALRTGQKCTFCHVNRTGGGKRTVVFNSIATAMLNPAGIFDGGPVPPGGFNGSIHEKVSLGANLRLTNTSVFKDDPDRDGNVDNDSFFRSADTNDFDVGEGVGYLQVDLLQNHVTLYVDELFAPGGASNREAVGIIDGLLPWAAYVKVGRFFPAFGLRLQDDAAFTRSATGFNFSREDTGVEIGVAPGFFFLAASITNGDGTEGNGFGKQVNLHGYGMFPGVLAGASILAGGSLSYNDPADRTVAGAHGGLSFAGVTVLGELDWIREDDQSGSAERWATHAEINWLVRPWLNVKLGYDYLEPDTDVKEDQRERYVLGIEPFLQENLQVRVFYRVNNDVPQRPEGNFNELLAELHLFF